MTEPTSEDLRRAFENMAEAAGSAQRMVGQLINGILVLGLLNLLLMTALVLVANR